MEMINFDSILLGEIFLFILLNSIWIGLFFGSKKKKYRRNSVEPKVSIIIPAYNNAQTIEKTINCVLKMDYPDKEIIVVNDGSTDNTLKICKKFEKQKKIKLISYSKNKGKAHALNRGIKSAKGEIIVTVDADSYPKPDSLKKLVKYFSDPMVGAVAGTIKVHKKKNFLTLSQSLEYIHQGFQRLCQSFINAVMVAPGPLTAYRKEALVKAGYFEDNTLVEDFDMTIKIHKVGYKVVSEKKAIAFTEVPITIKKWWRQRVRWSRGGVQIFKKHLDIFKSKNIKPLAYFSFPMHILWLGLPFILLPTFLFNICRGIHFSLQNFILSLSNLEFSLPNLTFYFSLKSRSIYLFFVSFQEWFLTFFGLDHYNPLIVFGYISVFLFLIFTALSFKNLNEKFKPKDLIALGLLNIYWFLLTIVGIYGIILELLSKKKEW